MRLNQLSNFDAKKVTTLASELADSVEYTNIHGFMVAILWEIPYYGKIQIHNIRISCDLG